MMMVRLTRPGRPCSASQCRLWVADGGGVGPRGAHHDGGVEIAAHGVGDGDVHGGRAVDHGHGEVAVEPRQGLPVQGAGQRVALVVSGQHEQAVRVCTEQGADIGEGAQVRVGDQLVVGGGHVGIHAHRQARALLRGNYRIGVVGKGGVGKPPSRQRLGPHSPSCATTTGWWPSTPTPPSETSRYAGPAGVFRRQTGRG